MASKAKKPVLVLASGSPRRRQLLWEAGFTFTIAIPAVAEGEPRPGMEPAAFARDLARRKAMSVVQAGNYPRAVILGADTIVVLDGRVLGKPRSRRDAFEMLSALSGRTHAVITGVALVANPGRRARIFSTRSRVRIRALTDAEIRAYHRRVDPMDKAGAYGLQEPGDSIVESVAGSVSNVVGLPMERVMRELKLFGVGS